MEVHEQDGVLFTLQSGDGFECKMTRQELDLNMVLKHMVEDTNNDGSMMIPLPSISGDMLKMVHEYCKENAGRDDVDLTCKLFEFTEFERDFVKDVPLEVIFAMINTANFLDNKMMLRVVIREVGNRIANKSERYVREFFGVENPEIEPTEEETLELYKTLPFLDVNDHVVEVVD